MCGICGIIRLGRFHDGRDMAGRVKGMLDALAHRGPDGSQVHGFGSAMFGFSRLSIRGLADGQQPLVDAEAGVMAVCNGEIDNHQELRAWLTGRGRAVAGATDVAVILPLYLELGGAFVERLVGAFAIVIWDQRDNKVILARDRTGERPLFYSVKDETVFFASQIAALAQDQAVVKRANQSALCDYMRAGYFAAPTTPFADIVKVPPAEIVTIDLDGVRNGRYWHWEIGQAVARRPSEQEFDVIFRDAVRRQSAVDVDFGVFLSGGIDSSLIAAVTRQVYPDKPLRAFTLRFNEGSYDEGAFAEAVAARLGIECTSVWVRPGDLPAILGDMIRSTGEPLADPAWIPAALLSRRAAQEIRVALSGEGADELFGGYPTYFGAGLANSYAKLPARMRGIIRKRVERWPPSDKKVTLSFLLKRFVLGEGLNPLARHRVWTASINPDVMATLGFAADAGEIEVAGSGKLLDMLQQFDLEHSLAEGLLTKADRAGMRFGLELRAPFLDRAVIEFAATLPGTERVRLFQTKRFLKRYALRYLPKDIVMRKKRGLSVPLAQWLRDPLFDWAQSRLDSPRLSHSGVDLAAVQVMLNEHRQRRADHARALWTLIVLSEWLAWADSLNFPNVSSASSETMASLQQIHAPHAITAEAV